MPTRVETGRLVLRTWRVADARQLKAAIDANLDHLRPWVPWAAREPSSLPDIEDRLAAFGSKFNDGREGPYAIFGKDERTLIGGIGLHPRVGPRAVEIGYWIERSQVRQGYATEATRAITGVALALDGIERVEIRCDPRNVASACVPRGLGYRHVRTIREEGFGLEEQPHELMIWELVRAAIPRDEGAV